MTQETVEDNGSLSAVDPVSTKTDDASSLVVFADTYQQLQCKGVGTLPDSVCQTMRTHSLMPVDILLLTLLDVHFEYDADAVARAFGAIKGGSAPLPAIAHLRPLYAPVLGAAFHESPSIIQDVLRQTYQVSPKLMPSRDRRQPAILQKQGNVLAQFEPFETPANLLGKGAFGAVYSATHRVDRQKYAIKIVDLTVRDPADANAMHRLSADLHDRVLKEVDALSRLTHPNVLRYYSSFVDPPSLMARTTKSKIASTYRRVVARRLDQLRTQNFSESDSDSCDEVTDSDDPTYYSDSSTTASGQMTRVTSRVRVGRVYIQTELCGPALDDYRGSDALLWSYLKDVLAGLAHLHGLGMTHRDVKPSNVFTASSPPRAVLGDFGLSTAFTTLLSGPDNMTSGAGTPRYMAPEQVTGTYGPAVDIWAFGVMVVELTLKPTTTTELLMTVHDLQVGSEQYYTSRWPKHAEIAACCLKTDPRDRPTAVQLMSDYFTADAELAQLRQRVVELEMQAMAV